MVKKYGAERGKGGVWRAKPARPSQRLGPAAVPAANAPAPSYAPRFYIPPFFIKKRGDVKF